MIVFYLLIWVWNIKEIINPFLISDQTWMPELKFKYWTDFTEEVPWICNRMHTAQPHCVDLLKISLNNVPPWIVSPFLKKNRT